jgi:hypothetical protein
MVLQEEKYELDGKEILLRSANENADRLSENRYRRDEIFDMRTG